MDNLLIGIIITAIVILSPYLLRSYRAWYSRNIIKGPSQFIHTLHCATNENIIALGNNEYSITDPHLISTIYSDKSFRKSDQYSIFDFNGEQSLFSIRDVDEHERRAKAVRSIFRPANVQSRQEMFERNVNRVLENVEAVGECNVLALMRGFMVQTTSHYLLGKSYKHSSSPLEVGVDFGLVIDDVNTTLGSMFGRSQRLFARLIAMCYTTRTSLETESATDDVISFAEQVGLDADYKARLSALGLSSIQLTTEIVDVLVAGTDAPATTLATALHYIYSSPSLLTRLRTDESLLEKCIDEALRIASPVPRRLPRVVPEGKEIMYPEDQHDDGWHKLIPEGSIVGIGAYSIHSQCPFPRSFNPDREQPLLIPFGKGVRACPGQYMARTVMKLMLKAMVHAFDGVVKTHGDPEYTDNFNATMTPTYIHFHSRTENLKDTTSSGVV